MRFNISADIRIKKYRVGNFIAVFTETADRNVNIKTYIVIHHAERDRAWRAVFIADQLFFVEVINSLILWRFAAECKSFAEVFERLNKTCAKVTLEDRRLS